MVKISGGEKPNEWEVAFMGGRMLSIDREDTLEEWGMGKVGH